MIDVAPLIKSLNERLEVATRLLDETHPAPPDVGPISREARGLAIVLLFAAYENLLTSLTRTLLEAAVRTRASNRRLQPGFRSFAIHDAAKSIRMVSEKKLFKALPRIIEVSSRGGYSSTIDTGAFPSDGSFMKRSQVELWAETFAIGDPRLILTRTWGSLDAVVSDRNGVAHGRLTPQEVGRNYTEREMRALIEDWRLDWTDFLNHVQILASSREFFRLPR